MLSVPPVLMSVPFSLIAVVALRLPVTERSPAEPLSVNVSNVLGVASASLTVRMPLVPVVASVIFGAALVKERGDAPESVSMPEAVMFVAPAIVPVLVTPPELLLIPPVILAPPAEIVNPPVEIVCPAVKVLD